MDRLVAARLLAAEAEWSYAAARRRHQRADAAAEELRETVVSRLPNGHDQAFAVIDGSVEESAGLAHAALGQRKAAKRHLEGYLGGAPEVEERMEVQQILEMLGIGEEGDPVEFSG